MIDIVHEREGRTGRIRILFSPNSFALGLRRHWAVQLPSGMTHGFANESEALASRYWGVA